MHLCSLDVAQRFQFDETLKFAVKNEKNLQEHTDLSDQFVAFLGDHAVYARSAHIGHTRCLILRPLVRQSLCTAAASVSQAALAAAVQLVHSQGLLEAQLECLGKSCAFGFGKSWISMTGIVA